MRLLRVDRYLIALFLLIMASQGIPYGMEGDSERYAQMLNRHVRQSTEQQLPALASFTKYDREPLFWFISGDVIPSVWRWPFTPVAICALSVLFVFLSFRLTLSTFSEALIAFTVFISTMQGFLVAFNLYRTAVAMLVFAACLWLLSRRRRGEPTPHLAVIIASLVAAMVHSAYLIQAVSFLKLPRRRVALIVYGVVIGGVCAFLVLGTGLASQAVYFWARFHREAVPWSIPMASPAIIGLVVLAVIVKRHGIQDPDHYLGPLVILVILMICSVILSFSLAFERIYILATFLFIVFAVRSGFASRRETAAFIMLNFANVAFQLYRSQRLFLPA